MERRLFCVFLLLGWLTVMVMGCTTGQDPPSPDQTSVQLGSTTTARPEQSSKQPTPSPVALSDEQLYTATSTILSTADQMLRDRENDGAPLEQAQTAVVSWLSQQAHVDSAGISSDGYSIWINFEYGVNAVLVTRLRGEPVPADYADQYNAYQASLNRSRIQLLSHPPVVTADQRISFSRPGGRTMLALNPVSQFGDSLSQPGGVGCLAWIFAPFQWETLTHSGKIIETERLRQLYTMSMQVPGMSAAIDKAIIYYNEAASIGALGAAISGHTGPAVILEINTHGGLTSRGGQEFSYLLSGQEMTVESFLLRFDEMQSGLLTWGVVGGKNFLAITPTFVEAYSGVPRPADHDWLVRYVHINACNSFRSSMVEAFILNGAVVFSGYTGPVGWKFGAESTIEFFVNLASLMNVQKAWEHLSIKTDPDYAQTNFAIAGNVDAHYFYRAFFTLDEIRLETPAFAWLVAYDAEDGGAGFYWALTAVEEESQFPVGRIIMQISDSQAGTYDAVADERVEIHLDYLGTRWSCSSEQANAGKPCTGTIEIREIADVHGGKITGTFTAQLVDSHQTDPPYQTKFITSHFTVIRNKPGD